MSPAMSRRKCSQPARRRRHNVRDQEEQVEQALMRVVVPDAAGHAGEANGGRGLRRSTLAARHSRRASAPEGCRSRASAAPGGRRNMQHRHLLGVWQLLEGSDESPRLSTWVGRPISSCFLLGLAISCFFILIFFRQNYAPTKYSRKFIYFVYYFVYYFYFFDVPD